MTRPHSPAHGIIVATPLAALIWCAITALVLS